MGKGEGGEGREGQKERDGTPKGWLTPHVQNPEKYPDCRSYTENKQHADATNIGCQNIERLPLRPQQKFSCPHH